MLAPALAVVQAARGLKLYLSDAGLWRLGAEPRHHKAVLKAIGEALSEFDRVTGQSKDPTGALVAMIRAPGSEIDISRLVDELRAGGPGVRAEAVLNLVPQPGELGPPDADPSSPDGYFHGVDNVPNDFARKYVDPDLERKLKGESPNEEAPDGPSSTPSSPRPGLKPSSKPRHLELMKAAGLGVIQERLRAILSRVGPEDSPRLKAVIGGFAAVLEEIGQGYTPSGTFVRMKPETISKLLSLTHELDLVDRELSDVPHHSFGPR